MGWRQSLHCSCLIQPGPLAEGEQVHTALVLLVRVKAMDRAYYRYLHLTEMTPESEPKPATSC